MRPNAVLTFRIGMLIKPLTPSDVSQIHWPGLPSSDFVSNDFRSIWSGTDSSCQANLTFKILVAYSWFHLRSKYPGWLVLWASMAPWALIHRDASGAEQMAIVQKSLDSEWMSGARRGLIPDRIAKNRMEVSRHFLKRASSHERMAATTMVKSQNNCERAVVHAET